MTNNETPRDLADLLGDYLTDLESAGIDRLARPRPETAARLFPRPPASESSAAPETEPPRLPIIPSTDGMTSMKTKIDEILSNFNPKSDKKAKSRTLELLAKVASGCTLCPELAAGRTNTVFGDGNPAAELVFIGEGPGAEEDRQGLPFVGRSGQLLTDIIVKGMKMSRTDVYICNIVRCRPPENRNPSPVEAACCRPFLDATLTVIRPKYICCLGSIAAHHLLESTEPIGRLRGRILESHGAQVVCTYHPAYLLRNPPAKTQTWEDIKLLLRTMGKMD